MRAGIGRRPRVLQKGGVGLLDQLPVVPGELRIDG